MTITILLCATLAFIATLAFTFLMTVYLKEYKREQKIIEEQLKMKKDIMDQYANLSNGQLPVVYLDLPIAAPKTKKTKTGAIDELPAINVGSDNKTKKNIN